MHSCEQKHQKEPHLRQFKIAELVVLVIFCHQTANIMTVTSLKRQWEALSDQAWQSNNRSWASDSEVLHAASVIAQNTTNRCRLHKWTVDTWPHNFFVNHWLGFGWGLTTEQTLAEGWKLCVVTDKSGFVAVYHWMCAQSLHDIWAKANWYKWPFLWPDTVFCTSLHQYVWIPPQGFLIITVMLGANTAVSKQTASLVPVLIKHCTFTKCFQVSAIIKKDEHTLLQLCWWKQVTFLLA